METNSALYSLLSALFWCCLGYWLFKKMKNSKEKNNSPATDFSFPATARASSDPLPEHSPSATRTFLPPPPKRSPTGEYRLDAFDQVMKGVVVDEDIRKVLRNAYHATDENGSSTDIERVFFSHLSDIQWDWPAYEHFKNKFLANSEFPYLWEKYTLCDDEEKEETLSDIIRLFTVKDIRKALADAGIDIPGKADREALEQLAIKNITSDQIIASAPERWEKMSQWRKNEWTNGRCKILAHTISSRAYVLRDFYQRTKKTSPDTYMATDAGCPVEEQYAALWNSGNLKGLPPFFPGDRTGIRLRSRKDRLSASH